MAVHFIAANNLNKMYVIRHSYQQQGNYLGTPKIQQSAFVKADGGSFMAASYPP